MLMNLTNLGKWLRHGNSIKLGLLLCCVIYCVTFYIIMAAIAPRATFRDGLLHLDLSNNNYNNNNNTNNPILVMMPNNYNPTGQPGGAAPGGPSGQPAPVLRLRGRVQKSGRSGGRGRGRGGQGEMGMGEVMEVDVPLDKSAWRRLREALKEAETALFPWQPPRVRRVDCRKLFQGDKQELERARRFELEATTTPLSAAKMADKMVATLAGNCGSLKRSMAFITSSLTEEEERFPIAYSLLVFKDAEQVLKLLRAIYRPQNYYCVHVDSKADGEFRKAVSSVADCFPNVFLTSQSVDVRWGTFTVLEPELLCMRELWPYSKWRYFINLTGQEFPLRTNHELVTILNAYQGANNLEGTRKRANTDRWKSLGPPPWGITPTKGSVHIVVNRDFVDFVLHSQVSRDFTQWVRNASVPDEIFFSSLNHNPHLGIRGAYTGEPETHPTTYPFLTRFKNWGVFPFNYSCASGKRVRMICILSSGDLPLLDSRPELFANKFYAEDSRVALDCLAQRIFNRTRDQFLGLAEDFDVSFYANMPFVRHMVNESFFNRTVL